MIYCKRNHQVQVLKSAAGYYIGTTAYDEDFGFEVPNCRLSTDYYPTKAKADIALENKTWSMRFCMENQFCARGGQCICIKGR